MLRLSSEAAKIQKGREKSSSKPSERPGVHRIFKTAKALVRVAHTRAHCTGDGTPCFLSLRGLHGSTLPGC